MTDSDSLFPIALTEDGEEALPVQGVISLLQDLVDMIPTKKVVVALEPQEPPPGTGSDYRASRKLLIHPDEKPRVFRGPTGKWTVDFKIRRDPRTQLDRPSATYVNRSRHQQSVLAYDSWKRALKAANWDVEARLADWVAVNDGLYD